jgi:hypothetical protein
MKTLLLPILLITSAASAQTAVAPKQLSGLADTLAKGRIQMPKASNSGGVNNPIQDQSPDFETGTGSQEGLPTGPISLNPQHTTAYSAIDILEDTLKERLTSDSDLPNSPELAREGGSLGQRIVYFREKSREIIRVSGTRIDEQLLRITVNRGVDIIDNMLAISGQNSDEISRWAANFYKANFKLAAMYYNSKFTLESASKPEHSVEALIQSRQMAPAAFGYHFATYVLSFSTNFTTPSAKAVMMIQALNYLGYDLSHDLRSSEREVAMSIEDVAKLQNGRLVESVLNSLRLGEPVDNQVERDLRGQVHNAMEKLRARLERIDLLKAVTMPTPKGAERAR